VWSTRRSESSVVMVPPCSRHKKANGTHENAALFPTYELGDVAARSAVGLNGRLGRVWSRVA